MADAFVLLTLLGLPLGLLLLTRKPGVQYRWGKTELTVRAGLRKHRFPYSQTVALLTETPLGERQFGVAAPGNYVGTFAFAGVPQRRVFALASRRLGPALLLQSGNGWHYLTPDDTAEALNRFANAPDRGPQRVG